MMTHDVRAALLRAAMAAAERGWPVFPLRPGTKRPALHGQSRCPHTGPCAQGHQGWERRATTDPVRIRACWGTAAYGIGLATGPAGLLVLDLDTADDDGGADGAASLAALCQRHGQPYPSDTYTVATPSGGSHLYFTAPPGAALRNTVSLLAPKVDTRAHGGYVVATGSTVDGRLYTEARGGRPAPLPAWLAALLTPPPRPPLAPAQAVRHVRDATAYVTAALRNETANVASAPSGARNAALTRAARALGRLIASGDLDRPGVEAALKQASAAAGLREHESAPTITHALNWSIAHNPQKAS